MLINLQNALCDSDKDNQNLIKNNAQNHPDEIF
jgi:hypothetical protein